MESIFFLINHIARSFKGNGKKIHIMLSKTYDAAVNLFRNDIQDVEDVQELSDAEYNRRFGKFFPKPNEECEEINSNSGFYISRIQAAAHGALSGPSGGGKGFYR